VARPTIFAGVFDATVREVVHPRAPAAFHAAAGARLGAEVELDRPLYLRAYAEIDVNLTRYQLMLGAQELYRMPAASGLGGVAVVGRF